MTLSSTSNGQNADEEDNNTELDNNDDDEKLHTDTSVMHLGFQDPLEREMKLYAALPLLRCVFVPSNISNLLVRSATVDPFKWYTNRIGIDIADFASLTNKFSYVYKHYAPLVQRFNRFPSFITSC